MQEIEMIILPLCIKAVLNSILSPYFLSKYSRGYFLRTYSFCFSWRGRIPFWRPLCWNGRVWITWNIVNSFNSHKPRDNSIHKYYAHHWDKEIFSKKKCFWYARLFSHKQIPQDIEGYIFVMVFRVILVNHSFRFKNTEVPSTNSWRDSKFHNILCLLFQFLSQFNMTGVDLWVGSKYTYKYCLISFLYLH